jgi:hypothetical protein
MVLSLHQSVIPDKPCSAFALQGAIRDPEPLAPVDRVLGPVSARKRLHAEPPGASTPEELSRRESVARGVTPSPLRGEGPQDEAPGATKHALQRARDDGAHCWSLKLQ